MKGSFKKIINSDIPVLIDFYATWCGPCKMMFPVLKDLKEDVGESLRIVKIDIDKNPSLANKYHIKGVPTLLLFKSGELVWRQSGVVPKNDILNVISNL